MVHYAAPDLTQFPPRSPRVRLGGYAHLPRLLDKARAFAAGKHGEYSYNCGMDAHFFTFTGIDHAALLAEVKKGLGDTEMLAWVRTQTKRLPAEIMAWTQWLEQHGNGSSEGHGKISALIKLRGPARDDVRTAFDVLDLDDYATFGGKG